MLHSAVLKRAEEARCEGDAQRFVSIVIKAADLPPAITQPVERGTRWLIETRPRGPIRVELSDAGLIEIELSLVALPRRLQVPLLRHALDVNRHLQAARVVLRGDRVFARYDTPFALATTAELALALRELTQLGPMLAHDFMQRFAARPPGANTPDGSVRAAAAATGATPDLVAHARTAQSQAAAVCATVEACLALVKPLSFRGDSALTCVLLLRAFIVDMLLDGSAPHLTSRLIHHGASLLAPLWPGDSERGWRRGIGRRAGPVQHAVAMVLPMMALLERVLADAGQIAPEPHRRIEPLNAARAIKGQARGVLRCLDEAPVLPGDARDRIALGTVRELLARGRLPPTIEGRLADALAQANADAAVAALRSMSA